MLRQTGKSNSNNSNKITSGTLKFIDFIRYRLILDLVNVIN